MSTNVYVCRERRYEKQSAFSLLFELAKEVAKGMEDLFHSPQPQLPLLKQGPLVYTRQKRSQAGGAGASGTLLPSTCLIKDPFLMKAEKGLLYAAQSTIIVLKSNCGASVEKGT